MKKGLFIVIDGLDGSGKDTVIKKLNKWYEKEGVSCKVVRDPSAKTARGIRNLVLKGKDFEPSTRLFLYLAARGELVKKEIEPALNEGMTVVSNRFTASTYAYQGLHFSQDTLDQFHNMAGIYIEPDAEFFLLSKTSLRGRDESSNAMDEFCDKNREEIARQFVRIAEKSGKKHVIWTDELSPKEVLEEVLSYL